jgi:hypothetical protein
MKWTCIELTPLYAELLERKKRQNHGFVASPTDSGRDVIMLHLEYTKDMINVKGYAYNHYSAAIPSIHAADYNMRNHLYSNNGSPTVMVNGERFAYDLFSDEERSFVLFALPDSSVFPMPSKTVMSIVDDNTAMSLLKEDLKKATDTKTNSNGDVLKTVSADLAKSVRAESVTPIIINSESPVDGNTKYNLLTVASAVPFGPVRQLPDINTIMVNAGMPPVLGKPKSVLQIYVSQILVEESGKSKLMTLFPLVNNSVPLVLGLHESSSLRSPSDVVKVSLGKPAMLEE